MTSPTNVASTKYRPEIDGLRSVSVISVVLFHAGIDFFSGGFVGVDIFFVISGYFITMIIIKDLHDNNFSLLSFYERRTRRILPALFFMATVTVPFAWYLMIPTDFKQFGDSLTAVTIYLSNFLFWREAGYFEQAAEMKPLLHTWSLAVEEQFYVFFPITMLVFYRYIKIKIWLILFLFLLTSLFYSDWASTNRISSNFYLLPSRIWELSSGALCAHIVFNHNKLFLSAFENKYICDFLCTTGFLLVFASIFIITDEIPFPSFYTIPTVAGACLILLFANSNNIIGKVLSHQYLVFIGLISYSTYLWHQPLIALSKHMPNHQESLITTAIIISLSFLLGYLSWRYIERPFRDRSRISRKVFWTCCITATLTIFCFGLFVSVNSGFSSRLSIADSKTLNYLDYNYDDSFRLGTCFLSSKHEESEFSRECSVNNTDYLLWGDSHAAALSSGIRKSLGPISQFTAYNCPPIIGTHFSKNPRCKELNNDILLQVELLKPRTIFLHANWSAYEKQLIIKELELTLDTIGSIDPTIRIVIIGGVPQWSSPLPVVIVRNKMKLEGQARISTPKLDSVKRVDIQVRNIANTKGVQFVSLVDHLCEKPADCIAIVEINNDYVPLHFDYGHLTKAGSEFSAKWLIKEIR